MSIVVGPLRPTCVAERFKESIK